MKKRISTRLLSAFLAFVMVFLMIPFSAIMVLAEEETLPKLDYTPFLIESANGRAVYNAQTVNMCYDFYTKARQYIDGETSDFTSIEHNGITYPVESVLYVPSDNYPTCDMLTCILNMPVIDGKIQHVILIAFRGTDFWDPQEVITDFAAVTGKDGYHNGFAGAAQKHYEYLMTKNVKYRLGNGEEISFADYIEKMSAGENDYKMIVTGHSLGAAVAGVFTSKYLDNKNSITATNAVAYTFASPLTCSDAQAEKEASIVKNVFNIVNSDDIVTKVGADAWDGQRTGYDFKYRVGKYDGAFDFDNHHMDTAYLPSKNYINSHINGYTNTYVLYNNYDKATHTYQRIVFNNGQLIVSGNGILAGDWTENTLIEWAKVKDDCTSIVFAPDCSITEIGDYAFAGMSQLSNELILPETVTKIGDYAFFHCGFNNDLIIPAAMKEVGINAFNGCSNLDTINALAATAMTWGYGAFANCVGQHDLLLPVEDSGTDLAKIFKTYYVQDNNGSYLIDVADATSGNIVLPGDKIYIGRIEDDKLNVRPYYDFHYFLTTGHTDTADNIKQLATNTLANVATVDESGCITISSNCKNGTEFTVVVMDNYKGNPDYDVYDSNRFIHFTVGTINDNFAGGVGTRERPYLIKNYDQLTRIKDDLSACYQLIANINCKDEEAWETLGDQTSAFTGTIDGMGYTIFDLSGETFIAYNEGTIQNIFLSGWSISKGSGTRTNVRTGIVTGENKVNGKIINCHIDNSTIDYSYSYNAANFTHSLGGMAAMNNGSIAHCSITNTTIKGYAKGGDGHFDVSLNIGGIAACNGSTGYIYNCASYDNVIYGYIYHNGIGGIWYDDDKSYAYFRLGGAIGYAEGGTVASTSYYNNSVSYERTYYDHNSVDDSKYAIISELYIGGGVARSNITANCVENSSKTSVLKSITDITIKSTPNKTHYYIGESLNLYGLQIQDNSNNTVNGYTISGFDSNKSGTQTLTVTYVTGYGTFTDTFDVTVENIIPQTVVVHPKEDCYDIQNTLSIDDFTATIYYNNGTTEIMESLSENVSEIVKFTTFTSSLNTKDTQVLPLNYHYAYMTVDGKAAASTSIVAYVSVTVNCDCLSTTTLNATPATVSAYGYTGDLVCSTCQSIVEEGAIIDMLECTDHNYGAWGKFDDTQHSRTCDCDEIEYAPHNWNDGIITKPSTHLVAGELTKTCYDCGATKLEAITPTTNHSFGSWTKHDETQHVHICECGETEYEDHSWDDGVITTPATYEQDGVKTYSCFDCEATYTAVIPKPLDIHLFVVDDAGAVPGGSMQVNVRLENNPGVALMRLKISYDSSMLTLDQVTYNTEIGGMTIEPVISNGYAILLWYNDSENVEGDWIFATLSFTVKESATVGSVSDIILTYDAEEVCDIEENNVVFSVDNGSASVLDHVPGDINGDGILTSKDLLRLARYFADWDVEVNEKALDVNGDGTVNSKDLLRLARYLAGWDVEIH